MAEVPAAARAGPSDVAIERQCVIERKSCTYHLIRGAYEGNRDRACRSIR
jgi:hypothetical protein